MSILIHSKESYEYLTEPKSYEYHFSIECTPVWFSSYVDKFNKLAIKIQNINPVDPVVTIHEINKLIEIYGFDFTMICN